jgi:hypothetical protein
LPTDATSPSAAARTSPLSDVAHVDGWDASSNRCGALTITAVAAARHARAAAAGHRGSRRPVGTDRVGWRRGTPLSLPVPPSADACRP